MSEEGRLNNGSETLERIKELLYEGRKIEAIKVYRDARGVVLKEAKEDVERLEAELREREPEKFKVGSGGKGCVGVLLLGIGIVGVVVMLFAVGS
jgi:dihydrodipicolinate synthase/N-acetylneuraminate lyase